MSLSCSFDSSLSLSAFFVNEGISFISKNSLDATRTARYVFGIRSDDSGPFQRLFNTVTSCTALPGFDVVFSVTGSPQIHCLPLGDFASETPDFFPALYFASMPGVQTFKCLLSHGQL